MMRRAAIVERLVARHLCEVRESPRGVYTVGVWAPEQVIAGTGASGPDRFVSVDFLNGLLGDDPDEEGPDVLPPPEEDI